MHENRVVDARRRRQSLEQFPCSDHSRYSFIGTVGELSAHMRPRHRHPWRHEMPQTFDGGCACGRVRYRLGSEPMFVHCCHCRDCQRQTGSAFVLNALIETDRVSIIADKPRPIAVPTESGRPHDIYRCSACQTAVWSDYGHRPGLRFVRVSTLDEPSALRPDVHIYTRSKLPWVVLPKDLPTFPAYYDAKVVWPTASLERRRAAVR
jgi:hypothetical protein